MLRSHFFFVSLGAMSASLSAATIQVPVDHLTIQAAINASANGDTVIVAPGTYNEAINFNGKNIAIESSGGAAVTTIDATVLNTSTVTIPNGPSTLKGFTVTGGKGTSFSGGATRLGGGLYVTGANVSIIDNVIAGNTAIGTHPDGFSTSGRGGGVYASGGSCTVKGCTLTNNKSQGACGGGHGGGFYGLDSQIILLDCVMTDNLAAGTACAGTASAYGGAVYVWDSSLTAINCTIDNNDSSGAAGAAAGLDIGGSKSQTTLINCLIARNNTHACCTGPGATSAGIRSAASLNLMQCTIASNTITGITGNPNAAGGVSGPTAAGTFITMTGSIVHNNVGLEIAGNASVQNSCVEGGYVGTGNIASDPMFVDAVSGNFRLMTGSPAIDVGDVSHLPADTFDLDGDGDTKEPLPIDLDGNRRVVNGYVDMGAYEWQRKCEPDIAPSAPGVVGDGSINVDDLLSVINAWGECDICVGDVNGDNLVNVDDLLAVINGWGTCQ